MIVNSLPLPPSNMHKTDHLRYLPAGKQKTEINPLPRKIAVYGRLVAFLYTGKNLRTATT